MEEIKKKCTNKEHKEIDAITYCQDCNIYICNKCTNYHQNIYEKHLTTEINKDNNEIFINICKEQNHLIKLQYYCKDHNKLCCGLCIAKLEGEGNGQHKNCNICFIKDIKEEKKNKLNDNIKYLEELSKNLDNSIKEIKIMFDKINENKEELKIKIQKISTNIRNTLNNREDELLLEVDNKYNDLFCNEELIKDSEKLPNKIKISIEKGRFINNNWDDNNQLNSIINNCINIEKNINNIKIINSNIDKLKLSPNIKFYFIPEEELLNNFIYIIKTFGYINIFNIHDSQILKNIEDKNNFYNLVSNKIQTKNCKLLYRYTRDGFDLEIIKNKINNKSNLIFLFFTGNKKIFGSYISIKLENIHHNKYFKDEKAFVFNLNKNKIYKILSPEKAIRFNNNVPILFGNDVNENGFWLSKDGNIYDHGLLNTPKIYDFQKNKELTDGLTKLEEFEIYEINPSS